MHTVSTFKDNELFNDNELTLIFEGNSNFLSYTVFDEKQNLYKGIKNLLFDNPQDLENSFEQILNEDYILKTKFKKEYFIYNSYRAMLVPDTLFDSEHLNEFLKFHHNVNEKELILYHKLEQAEAYVIFTIPIRYEYILHKKYPDVNIFHHSIPFISNSLKESQDEQYPILCINVSSDFFDVLIAKKGQILLFNSFFYRKHSDIVYFIVNIINLYSLTTEHTKLILTGNIDLNSVLVVELKKIFPLINFTGFNNSFNFTEETKSLEQHKYSNLINFLHCVS